jgi:starch synthase
MSVCLAHPERRTANDQRTAQTTESVTDERSAQAANGAALGSPDRVGGEAVRENGGLADVLGSLPPPWHRLGCDVTVVLPRYQGARKAATGRFALTVGGYTADVGFIEVPLGTFHQGGARAILADCPELYDRDDLYGIGTAISTTRRFAPLARAALSSGGRQGTRPSVIHAHDWQAGLAPVYLKSMYAEHPVIGGTPVVFTIHNLSYQGLFDPGWLPQLDLGWEQFTIERMEFWHRISFLKGGINDAEIVTTVSRRALKKSDAGVGIRLRRNPARAAANLVGILNGIDTGEVNWRPTAIRPCRLPGGSLGKAAAKAELCGATGLRSGSALDGRSYGLADGRSGKGLISSRRVPARPFADATFVGGTGDRHQDL